MTNSAATMASVASVRFMAIPSSEDTVVNVTLMQRFYSHRHANASAWGANRCVNAIALPQT